MNDVAAPITPISSLLSPRDSMCRARKFHNAAKPTNTNGKEYGE